VSTIEELWPHSSLEELMAAAIALLAAIILMLLTRMIAPRQKRVPYGLAILLLALAALAFTAHLLISWPGAKALFGGVALFFYALAMARLLFLFAFDGLLARSRREQLPRILRDITQGLLFFVAALIALHGAGVEPGQLLTTSALLTVVAGMALQETLGNLVAGLAIQGERPFEVGDWIEVHGNPGHIGRVREINWRATRLTTLDNVDVIVPNGLLAKATVTNYDRPHRAARRSIYFHIGYNVPPRRVHEVVLPMVRECPGVLADPPPSMVTHGFDESGVNFWLRYYIDEMGRRDGIDGGVRDRIWYALERAAIDFGFPKRKVALHEVSEETERKQRTKELEARVEAIGKIDLFSSLPPEELRRLAEDVRSELYAAGEVVIRRGDRGNTMFVVSSGELAVRVESNGTETEAARLGTGAFFGEMSLLTGDPRQATIVALSTCELLVIDHHAFQQLFTQHPDVAKEISEKVIERRRGLANVAMTPAQKQEVEAERKDLINRIRGFFGL
jgi:small-conductance mechanosensitive channel/CRP-like cAMP-binding protein